jgi:hypothetical protein
LFYQARKKFDAAMSIINKKMATVLDKEQTEAQKIFPHYLNDLKQMESSITSILEPLFPLQSPLT